MTVLLLLFVTAVLIVGAAEFVRSTCRKQLESPVLVRPLLQHADAE